MAAKPKFEWGQHLGLEECPYARRWVADFGRFGTLRIHHFYKSDDERALHDHPWWFLTFVFKGGYTDVHDCPHCDGVGALYPGSAIVCPGCLNSKWGPGRVGDHLRAPAIRFRPAEHRHTVQTDPGGAWTFLVTGPKKRIWGFWVERAGETTKRLLRNEKYFRKYGHHPCER